MWKLYLSIVCWARMVFIMLQFAPVKHNTVWGTIIISKIKTCHVQYWRQNGNAWKRQLSIEIYIVQRANVHSRYWQQTCNIFYGGCLSSSLCVFGYLSLCTGHYSIYQPKSWASIKCHCSAESANAAIWQWLMTVPGSCVLHDTNFKLLNLKLKLNLLCWFGFFFLRTLPLVR